MIEHLVKPSLPPALTDRERLASLSVVIPTLNAAGGLAAAIAALRGWPGEVLVVDGGSGDGTAAVAAAAGARVLTAAPGRGGQIATGIEASRGDWLLLLHADTWLAPGWESVAAAAMREPGRAGYFRFRLDDRGPAARRLEAAVAWRCRCLGLPYGDQGLLISRALLEAAGGVRPLPLMEDVDLIGRLGRRRLVALAADAVTSAARWQRDGWAWRSTRNLAFLALWRMGVSPERLARFYAR